MLAVLLTGPTVMQNSLFSASVMARGPLPVLICVYPQSDRHAELTRVAG